MQPANIFYQPSLSLGLCNKLNSNSFPLAFNELLLHGREGLGLKEKESGARMFFPSNLISLLNLL